MMIVDSHCHLNLLRQADYPEGVDAIIASAQRAGVSAFLCVGIDAQSSQQAIQLAEQYDSVYASVGIHPSASAAEVVDDSLIALAHNPSVVAVGETGLDYHYDGPDLEQMQMRFRAHIRLARQLNKPLIIHTRAAKADTITIMEQEQAVEAGGVMHCFTEDLEMAEQAMAMGFYISFSGILTFKNADTLKKVAAAIPIERILIETDTPYLAPVPYRGKPNKPEYVRLVAEQLAALRSCSVEAVMKQTTENFYQLFKDAKPL